MGRNQLPAPCIAHVAQSGERWSVEPEVAGSKPVMCANFGPVAQWTRAAAFEAVGWEFESLQDRQVSVSHAFNLSVQSCWKIKHRVQHGAGMGQGAKPINLPPVDLGLTLRRSVEWCVRIAPGEPTLAGRPGWPRPAHNRDVSWFDSTLCFQSNQDVAQKKSTRLGSERPGSQNSPS